MAANAEKLKTSLYVGDLHPDVTETDLFETFSRVAPLDSVHLCRDKYSRNYKSLCYAFVNFLLPSHASAALDCLNHSPLKGKTIRIMWHERDPIAKKDNNGNLYVKNLDKSITSRRLQEVFSKYGVILSCKVCEENGISKGFGYVQFKSEDSAIAARSALHDSFLEGKKLYVSKFIRKEERNGTEAAFRSLFVKNLDEDITTDALKAMFSDYGTVCSVVIMKDDKGKSRGFGFVNFDSHEAAKRALECLHGATLGSKSIFVSRALKKSELRKNFRRRPAYTHPYYSNGANSFNMVVKNVHQSVDGRRLYGSAKPVWNWNGGVSPQFSYGCFPYPCNTKKAWNSLAGNSQEKTLSVAVAKPKEQEAMKLQKYPPQQFYARPPFCNFPYFQKPSPWKHTAHQHFDGCYHPRHPIIPRSYNALHLGVAALNEQQEMYLEMAKDQKPSSPAKVSDNGYVEELSNTNRQGYRPQASSGSESSGLFQEG